MIFIYIYTYIFELKKQCSQASEKGFHGVMFDEQKMELPKKAVMVNKNVAWGVIKITQKMISKDILRIQIKI